ncbi:MAG: GFA family protein [Parvularculaceae bacterium]|nr:GFA family protein [Parvularculaceae bacterium]
MKKVSLPLTGGCHCGALRYELTAPPVTVYNCHCTNCQKITGGAFVVSAMVPQDEFRFTKGEPKKAEWISDAGNRRYGCFCGDCGGRIVHGQTPPGAIAAIRAGTLDDTGWLEPVGDIWTKSAQKWLRFDKLVADGQPRDFAPFIEAFKAQGRF